MKKYVFGVDVGGTTVKLGYFTTEGELLDKWEIKTDTSDKGKNILSDIAGSIKGKISEKNIPAEEIIGCGIGVPGPVDDEGVVYRAVNLGWDIFNLQRELEEKLGMPVKAANDANIAALGEQWKGAGEGVPSIVMVTLGTGIGGGIVINGRVVSGSTGSAGEIGHLHVNDEETEVCGCGNKGCLEQYGSATGIARLARRYARKNPGASRLAAAEVTAKTVFDGVKERDEDCMAVAEGFGSYLGTGLANVAAVVNPDMIVIGGGVSKAGEVVVDYVKKYFEERCFHACRNTRFAIARLGNDAGIYGAAKLCL